MTDLLSIFQDLVEQWGSFLVAKLCLTSTLEGNAQEHKISLVASKSPVFQTGFEISRTAALQNVEMMSKTVELVIFQFHSHSFFPKLFSDLLALMDLIFGSPISEIAKRKNEKALHTDKMVAAEELSEMDKVCIEVFKYLSSTLDAAVTSEGVDLNQIQLESVSVVFNYVEHYLPHSVRANAGKIIASLSASPKHAEMICKMFWERFSSLKKDKDFRNFSTWIDGIMGLQLSLDTPDLVRTSVSFLSSFVTKSKKIERGVLRMKFLACISAVLERICRSENLSECAEVVAKIDEIYQIVLKWSERKKHLVFCLECLGKMMTITYPGFFVKHASQFFEFLYKVTKSEKGQVQVLEIMLDVFKNMPKEYYVDNAAELKTNVEQHLLRLFFSTKTKIKKPKFVEREQNELVIQVLVQIGLKSMSLIIDFIKSMFSDAAQEENPAGRMRCLAVLAELVRAKPDEVETFNNDLFPFIQPMLLGTSPNKDEIEFAVLTFPVIHPEDGEVLASIANALFELAIGDNPQVGSSAFLALTSYVEKLVTVEKNTTVPLELMSKLMENMATHKKIDIALRLPYLYGLLNSFSVAMGKDLEKLKRLSSPTFKAEDWKKFRESMDQALFPLLVYPDKEIVKSVGEIEQLCLSEAIFELDKSCISAPLSLPQACADVTGSDYLPAAKALQEKNPQLMKRLFASTVTLWKEHANDLSDTFLAKIINLLAVTARVEYDLTGFFEELFNCLKKEATDARVLQALQLLTPVLLVSLVGDLKIWLGSVGLDPVRFWRPLTNLYYAIATRPEFPQLLADEVKLLDAFETYIGTLWKSPHKFGSKESYLDCEKSMKVMALYVLHSPAHFSRIVSKSQNTFTQFLCALQGFIKFKEAAMFSPTLIETFLYTWTIVFEYAKLDNYNVFTKFMKWLGRLDTFCAAKETCQVLLVKVLTILLEKNPVLLHLYFKNSCLKDGNFVSKFLLAMANVFKRREADFAQAFEKGTVYLLAAALLNLRNDHALARQAADKLMSILISSGVSIFAGEVQTELMMSLTSYSPAGYVTQAQHFVSFIGKSLKPDAAVELFQIIASDLQLVEIPQAPILNALDIILPSVVENCSSDASTRILLKLSAHANLGDTETAIEIRRMWDHYLDLISAEAANSLMLYVFDHTVNQPDLKSMETSVGINVLIFIFFKHPKMITDLLLPILCTYDRTIPSDVKEFLAYLETPEVDFSVSKKEVIACNALSQMLLLIEDKSLFDELFLSRLPQLTFYAILMFDNDQFLIGPFHPLLDCILDAALFRFATSQEQFTKNLQTLQSANLVQRAASLDIEYQVTTDLTHSKHMLCYDQNAICAVSEILGQADPDFHTKFFNLLLANGFKVKTCDREIEPFLMIMALNREMTTETLFRILLFAVHAFTHDRKDLLDSIADIVRQRLMSPDLGETTFHDEVVPVLIVFLLYLSLDCRRSLSIHIIRVLGELGQKVCTLEAKEDVAKELIQFLEQYGGGEYVASLFVRFIADASTFGDPSVSDIIGSLYQLSRVQSFATGSPYDWCMLLALLTDGVRYFTAKCTARHVEPVIHVDGLDWSDVHAFGAFLSEHFSDPRQQSFVFQYVGSLFKTFKSSDLGRDTAAMQILNEFIACAHPRLEASLRDSVIRTALLMSFSSDDLGVNEAARVIAGLMSGQGKVSDNLLSIPDIGPQFREVTLRPIGHYQATKRRAVEQGSLPQFKLFQLIEASSVGIVDTLYCYISTHLISVLGQ